MLVRLFKRVCLTALICVGVVVSGCAYDPLPQRTPDGFNPPYDYY